VKKYYNYIFTALILFGLNLQISAQPLKFKQLTMESGLSNNRVFTIIQDRIGFMWFGTSDGLNRYDGYSFKVFRHDPNDSNSVSNNYIEALFEDSNSNIWIGTKDGILNKYDHVKDKFSHWKLKSDVSGYNSITSIYEDSKSNIWIGTRIDGLYKLDPKNSLIDHWTVKLDDVNSLSNNYVTSIIEDNNGNIIVSTYNGLNILNPNKPNDGFKIFYCEANNSNSLSGNIIWTLSKSSIDPNIIFIGTFQHVTKYNSIDSTFERIKIANPNKLQLGTSCGYTIDEIIEGEKILWINSYAGLIRINLSSGKTNRFIHDDNDPYSLINDQINLLFKDQTGILWLATEGGISYITPKSTLFNSSRHNYDNDNFTSSLDKKNITAISMFENDRIWIGTIDGLYLLSNMNVKPQIKNISKFNGYYIWSIESVSRDEIWVGTYGQGLKQFNYIKNKITNWDLDEIKYRGQSVYFNKSLLEDRKKNIWIGYWGVGVARINPKTGSHSIWLNDPKNPNSLSYNNVWVIKEDQLGRIWIGTEGGGLNLFNDKEGSIFYHWLITGDKNQRLSSNSIYSICETKRNKGSNNSETTLWVGTNNGLNKFVIKNNKPNSNIYDIDVKIEHFSVKDGLSDNNVNSIVEDNNGNLWLGTNLGISFFDVSKKSFSNFSTEDGIKGQIMNQGSVLNINNGLILFGSTEGLNILEPAKIKLSLYKPNLVITDFQIFNKSVKTGSSFILEKSIQTTKRIKLYYDQEVFSFEFAALDYNSPQTIQYAYMMEGFDKDWIKSGSRRYVTYTNLDPGEYTFKVKSTNADCVWNDKGKSILIIIEPPFWKNWWAYITYAIVFIITFFSFKKYKTKKRRKKEEDERRTMLEKEKLKQSQLKLEAAEYKTKVLESEKEIEKQQIRNRISTDLHDEIGSNLSSIILLSSLVKNKQNYDKEIKKYLSAIHGAAKTSAEAIRDIVWFINPASDQIDQLASKMVETANVMLGDIKHEIKNINFDVLEKLQPDVKRNIFLIYKEILTNIIKHSRADFVSISIMKKNNTFIFSVADNGIGFNLNSKNNGNGLRNLKYRANQINGNLQISSESMKGTTITFEYKMA